MCRYFKFMLVASVALLLAAGTGSAKVFVVDDDGVPPTYPTLANALASAQLDLNGPHQIMILHGDYTDNGLIVPTNVDHIYGDPVEDRANIVFHAPQFQAVDFLYFDTAAGQTIMDGLTIEHLTIKEYQYALMGGVVNDIVIKDIEFDDNGPDGYDTLTSTGDLGGAIVLLDCDDGLFEDLYIHDGEFGIFLTEYPFLDPNGDPSNGNTIRNCVIEVNEQYGIGIGWYASGTHGAPINNTIEGNTVSESEDFGIQIRGAGNAGNVIKDNVVFDCIWEGILINGAVSGTIEGNEVYGNAFQVSNPSGGNDNTGLKYTGIKLQGSNSNVHVKNNVCYNNGDDSLGYGVYVESGGLNIKVYDNCFWGHVGNQGYDVSDVSGYWARNYYSDLAAGAINYPVEGGVEIDYSPVMRDNSPVASSSTMEVWFSQVVDFMWTLPSTCDPYDSVNFAFYDFTVSFDTSLLKVNSATDYDNDEFFGPLDPAFYIKGGDWEGGTLTFAGMNMGFPNYDAGRLAWAEFQAVGVGPAIITISSTYRDSLGNDIPVSTTALTLTLQDTEPPMAFDVVLNDPLGLGDTTYSDFVGMEFSAKASDNFALKRFLYKLDGGGWNYPGNASGTLDSIKDFAVDISSLLSDGQHTLSVYAQDQQDLISDPVDVTFYIDRTPPMLTSWTMSDPNCPVGSEYTNEVTVDVAFVDDNATNPVDSIEFAYAGSPEGRLKYPQATFTLHTGGSPPTEGLHTVHVQLTDYYGNTMVGWVPETITYDTTPSSPSGLTLDGGALKTNDPDAKISVSGTWSVATGSAFYMLTETYDSIHCGSSDWIPMVGPPWVFDFYLIQEERLHRVFRACLDSAGNVSAIDSADITWDITAPQFLTFVINNDDLCSDDASATVADVTWDDVLYPDVDSIGLSLAQGGPYTYFAATGSPQSVPFSMLPAWTGTDSLYTMYGVLKDDIGNEGAEDSDDIFLDGNDPTVTSVDAQDNDYPSTDPPIYTNWSNDANITLHIVGLSLDVETLWVSEDYGAFVGYPVSSPPDPYAYSYTFTNPTEQVKHFIDLYAEDCSGRTSATVSTYIYFDMAASSPPTIDTFIVTSENPTDVLLVDLKIDADDDNFVTGTPWKYSVWEETFTGPGWTSYPGNPATPSLTLDIGPGDGERIIWLKVCDYAGNVSTQSTTVEVDTTDPAGTMSIRQIAANNPLATTGYTNSLTGNEAYDIDWSGSGAVLMQLGNLNTPYNYTSWEPVATTYGPWTLADPAGTCGTRTVRIRFQDAAGNVGPWYSATIEYRDQTACPPAAPVASGTPGGSIDMFWSPVNLAQYYYGRYELTEDYPEFVLGPAPHPADTLEGHLEFDILMDTFYVFTGPQRDIYSFSLWTIDLAGNMSTGPDSSMTETDYILGDVSEDGIMTFVEDFGLWATVFELGGSHPDFLPVCDIGPTVDNSGTGYPIPDDTIDAEDMMIMGMCYDAYGPKDKGLFPPPTRGGATDMIALTALIPDEIRPNSEFTVSITGDNVSAIKGFHLVFGYDNESVELVSVKPGAMFESVKESFFYQSRNSANIDVSGIVLGAGVVFEGNEIIRATFRAPADGSFDLKASELWVRDRENQDIEVEFSSVSLVVSATLPTEFALFQNYPNPFNPTTTIGFSLPVASDYSLKVYNVAGQLVRSFDGHAEAGNHSIEWDASNYSSGVYFYKLEADKFTETKKMVLLK